MSSKITKIKSQDHIDTLKIRTESNSRGIIKTLILLAVIAVQASIFLLLYFYVINLFQWYFVLSMILCISACIHVLSSEYHGQAKATWIFFMLISFGFGYFLYLFSDKRVIFRKYSKKINVILDRNKKHIKDNKIDKNVPAPIRNTCNLLKNLGLFNSYSNSKTTYFESGYKFFDDILEQIEKAKKFIFIDFYIISNGKLLDKFLKVLEKKANEGVEIKIIYDDMGTRDLSKKIIKKIKKSGIEIHGFNKLVPVFNVGLNIRSHRKIIVIDGKISYTGGANLADEYTNEKRLYGYWKDSGIKVEGEATNNFTISFLSEWELLTNKKIDLSKYLYSDNNSNIKTSEVVIPFTSGPNQNISIAHQTYISMIENAQEKLYITTPYFIIDETIKNLLINKAKSGVDISIILPHIADKKFVYVVTRNNAEKLIPHGIKVFTMTNSFVHSKMILTENSCIVGSINFDHRSFNQQFESAVFTNSKTTLDKINKDFEFMFSYSEQITKKNMKRNKLSFRLLAGTINIVSPFM